MSRAKKQKVEVSSDSAEIKVQIAKNGIPLDEHIPQHFNASHHVLREGDEVWDAKLNCSNSTANNNKFYIIQLLEGDNGQENTYYVWTRWGRVGKVSTLFPSSQFFALVKIEWQDMMDRTVWMAL
jgi:poly [ADP-ribose] polymerase